jgi:hypothetical protein
LRGWAGCHSRAATGSKIRCISNAPLPKMLLRSTGHERRQCVPSPRRHQGASVEVARPASGLSGRVRGLLGRHYKHAAVDVEGLRRPPVCAHAHSHGYGGRLSDKQTRGQRGLRGQRRRGQRGRGPCTEIRWARAWRSSRGGCSDGRSCASSSCAVS